MIDSPFKQSGRREKEKAPKPFTAPTSSLWYSKFSLRNTLKSPVRPSRLTNFNRARTVHRVSKDPGLRLSVVCSSV